MESLQRPPQEMGFTGGAGQSLRCRENRGLDGAWMCLQTGLPTLLHARRLVAPSQPRGTAQRSSYIDISELLFGRFKLYQGSWRPTVVAYRVVALRDGPPVSHMSPCLVRPTERCAGPLAGSRWSRSRIVWGSDCLSGLIQKYLPPHCRPRCLGSP